MTPGPTPVDSEKPRSALIRESLVKDLDHLSSLAGREDWRQNISSIVDFGVDFSYAEVTFGSVGTRALKDILSWMPTDQLKFVSIKLLLLHLHLLLEEYNSTAGDLGKQQEIMLRSIEPLQRCCEAFTEAQTALPTNVDFVRASLRWIIGRQFKFPASLWTSESSLASFVDAVARVLVALIGGASLVAPLIMMMYLTSKTARLSIICAFVFVFSIFMGIATKGSNQEVLGATAAYAAVLVVFVGTSS